MLVVFFFFKFLFWYCVILVFASQSQSLLRCRCCWLGLFFGCCCYCELKISEMSLMIALDDMTSTAQFYSHKKWWHNELISLTQQQTLNNAFRRELMAVKVRVRPQHNIFNRLIWICSYFSRSRYLYSRIRRLNAYTSTARFGILRSQSWPKIYF